MDEKINIGKNVYSNLQFKKIDSKKFPSIKILNKLNNKNTLFETVIVSANDELVDLFLKDEIKFTDITSILIKILSNKKYKQYQQIIPFYLSPLYKCQFKDQKILQDYLYHVFFQP